MWSLDSPPCNANNSWTGGQSPSGRFWDAAVEPSMNNGQNCWAAPIGVGINQSINHASLDWPNPTPLDRHISPVPVCSSPRVWSSVAQPNPSWEALCFRCAHSAVPHSRGSLLEKEWHTTSMLGLLPRLGPFLCGLFPAWFPGRRRLLN